MKKLDLIGQRFGFLEVIKEGPRKVYNKGNSQRQWLCRCICGNEILIASTYLLRQKHGKRSCGCKSYIGIVHGNTKVENPQLVSYRSLIKRYRNSAKHSIKGICWLLNENETINLFNGNCYYCGVKPHNTYNVYIQKNGKFITRNIERAKQAEIKFNGIDRIDSDMDYVIDNVVSCCSNCNFAKNNMKIDEFYTWIARLVKHQINKHNVDISNVSYKNAQKMFTIYKRRALERGIFFELDKDDVAIFISSNCFYCGAAPFNGIDRRDNNVGYVKYNCVSCCYTCNAAKLTLDETAFLTHIEKIYNYKIKIRNM